MVLKGFRDRERLGTKLRLRAWASESSPESAGTLSAVGRREEIGHFIYGSVGSQRGQEAWIYQIGNLISLTASAVQCHIMAIHFAC